MTGLLKFTFIELKLLLRDLSSVFFPLVIPLFVLVIFGISYEVSDASLPATAVAIALALQALYSVPTYLGNYREQGVLRRLSTTPVNPATLLAAQLVVHLLVTLAAVMLVFTAATVGLGVTPPQHPIGAFAAFSLGITTMFSIGLLIAALAPNGRAATGTGVLLYFPLAFLGGLLVPREQMPQLIARIGDFTPLGAFRQTVQDAWTGISPEPLQLGIMVVYAIIFGTAAARYFRWE